MLVLRLIRLTAMFVIFTNLKQSDGRILRTHCSEYANFSYVRQNEVLQGSVMATIINKSPDECQSECVARQFCKSVNSEDSGDKRCELNRESEADKSSGLSLVPRAGWTFRSTSYTERMIGKLCNKLDPCGKDYLCVDVCYCQGFRCSPCKELKDGKTCTVGMHNVARGKETAQSSTWGKLYSWKAVDGNSVDRVWRRVYEAYSCVATRLNNNAIWWRVHFGGPAKIYIVKVYGRADGYSRDSNLKMRIGNKDQNGVNPVAINSFSLVITPHIFEKTLDQPMVGRYLFIESRVALSLCEVIATGYLLDF
eukprot:Seg1561.3 transcript_id=Seg1561.3/GoldUCD/mRNA.D3Y31 product="hypothetical protein" protein_id=Seg1561.3/GoldUCD/D3Y31